MTLVVAQIQSPDAPGDAPVSNPLLVGGQDGTPGLVRVMAVDAAGRPVIAGSGVAGMPDGGVVSVQGVVAGIPQPVTIRPGAQPPTSTPVTVAADTPLAISNTTTTEYVIPAGKTLHIQQIASGAEGDPTEKGSKIEVAYFDGTTEHLIERLYLTGFTSYGAFPDVNTARDGTALTGNGATKLLRVRRMRLSGSSQEVDCVVRGYIL